jgi:hypothetical protein
VADRRSADQESGMDAAKLDHFEAAIEAIEATYNELGHTLGWRFLCVSRRVLLGDPAIVLLTSNPGGRGIPVDHPSASCEHGCAYIAESWGNSPPGASVLQVQVQKLFDAIAERLPSMPRGPDLMGESLIGYFIPFRSPRLTQLHRPRESIRFAKQLWTEVLQLTRPRLLVALDPAAYSGLQDVCSATGGVRVSSEACATGWGNITAEIAEYRFPDRSAMTVRLPHLSTFKLFSRAECLPHLNEIIDKGCKHL